MKILAYIGSNKGNASITKKITEDVINALCNAFDFEFEVDIYTGKDVNIKECKGCIECFNNGKCNCDYTDDMGIIREKIDRADIVVFASPSYALHVSSNMKKIIDRLSSGFHHMSFAGKCGIAISTCSGSGGDNVCNYLEEILECFGAYVLGKVHYAAKNGAGKRYMEEKKCIIESLNEYIKKLDNEEFECVPRQEELFQSYKFIYEGNVEKREEVYEVRKWLEVCDKNEKNFNEFYINKYNERKKQDGNIK